MYIKLLLFLICLLGLAWRNAFAQNTTVRAYQYWFDDNIIERKTINITPSVEFITPQQLDVTRLKIGLHTLHFRYLDSKGLYSSPVSSYFWKAGSTVAMYEYWFDDNFNARNKVVLPTPSNAFTLTNLDVKALKIGLHKISLRFADGLGVYSAPIDASFWKIGDNITEFEYWVGSDFESRKQLKLQSPSSTLNLSEIPIGHIPNGYHTLHFRFKDALGVYSSPSSMFLYLNKSGVGIIKYEYWFDNDRRTLVATNTPVSNPYKLLEQIKVTALDSGLHTFHSRFLDKSGLWSVATIDTFEICKLRINRLSPEAGGNNGFVTVYVNGTCFNKTESYTAYLTGNGKEIKADTAVYENRSTLRLVFDLRGKSKGVYGLRIQDSGGETAVKSKAFTVEDGRDPQPWVDIVGLDRIRVGAAGTYTLVYGNKGNTDALMVPLYIAVSRQATIKFDVDLEGADTIQRPERTVPILEPLSIELDSINGKSFNGKLYVLALPYIPAGYTGQFKITVRTPNFEDLALHAWVTKPLFDASGTYKTQGLAEWRECFYTILTNPLVKDKIKKFVTDFLVEQLGQDYKNIAECVTQILHTVGWEIVQVNLKKPQIPTATEYFSKKKVLDLGRNVADAIVKCGVAAGKMTPWGKSATTAMFLLKWVSFMWSLHDDCFAAKPTNQVTLPIRPVASLDPNEKIGARGFGKQHYIANREALRYTILFENKDTIINGNPTIPVQSLTIIDTLEINKLDLQSFVFAGLGFGGKVYYQGTPGLYKTNDLIDLRPEQNLVVQYKLKIDQTKGIVRWDFDALDPETLEPPADPLVGFLPPNKRRPEGEGFIIFNVKPKTSIGTNSEIKNRASIYFDFNPPIITPYWVNRFDFDAPQSKVNALVDRVNDSTFNVSWSGTDKGVGALTYTIYYSENGAPYQIWKTGTKQTSDTFYGKRGACYWFYSIAQDGVNNLEEKQPTIEARTCGVSRTNLTAPSFTFKVYPNPSTGQSKLTFTLAQPDSLSIFIYDLSGRLLANPYQNTVIPQGQQELPLNLSNLVNGAYVVHVRTTTQGDYHQRMIIAR